MSRKQSCVPISHQPSSAFIETLLAQTAVLTPWMILHRSNQATKKIKGIFRDFKQNGIRTKREKAEIKERIGSSARMAKSKCREWVEVGKREGGRESVEHQILEHSSVG